MYIQLDEQNEYLREIPQGNFKFSDTVFQPAHTLTPEQCAHFRVHALVTVSQPEHNALTHLVRAVDPVLIAGQWTQQWEVSPLPAEEVVANQAAARAAKWEAIKAERDRRKVLGVKVGTDWFHCDTDSRGQWERMVNRVNTQGLVDSAGYTIGGQPVPWKTMTGSFVILTAGKIRAVVDAVELQEAIIFGRAEMHRVAMEASDSPESYDFSGGWPASIEDTP